MDARAPIASNHMGAAFKVSGNASKTCANADARPDAPIRLHACASKRRADDPYWVMAGPSTHLKARGLDYLPCYIIHHLHVVSQVVVAVLANVATNVTETLIRIEPPSTWRGTQTINGAKLRLALSALAPYLH